MNEFVINNKSCNTNKQNNTIYLLTCIKGDPLPIKTSNSNLFEYIKKTFNKITIYNHKTKQ